MTTGEGTSWKERREFEERISNGFALRTAETRRLIEDADAGERATAIVEALEEALRSEFGIAVVDSTTDDDEGQIRLELIQVEPDEESLDSIGE